MHRAAISSSSARRVDLAGRVVRRVDDDRPRPRPERRAQLVGVDRPVRLVERHVARDGAGEDRVGSVVLVVRLEDDDLVARVQQPEHGGHHRLGRAAGDGHLGLGIDRAPAGEMAGGRGRDRVAQRLAAPGDRVLVDVVAHGRRGGVLELGRAREVGEALGQADRAGRNGQPVHLADDRFAEAFGLGRDPGACHGPQSSPRAGRRSGQTRRRAIVSLQARRKNGSPSTSTSRSTVRWNASASLVWVERARISVSKACSRQR